MEFPPGAFLPRLVHLLGCLIMRPWVQFAFRCRVRRATPELPRPCVLAANHRSFFDPPFVGMWQPLPLSYFARASLWQMPFVRFMLQLMYGIPVDRDHPGASSTRGAIQRLRQGISVLVFPEGTRTRTGRLQPMRDGPALFARRAGVPVVPIYLHRSEAVWPRGRPLPRLWGASIELRIGRPLTPPAHLPPHLQDRWVTRAVEAWMHRQERACQQGHAGLRDAPVPEDAAHG